MQSQEVGWNYIYDYAIPSAINANNVPDNKDGHYQHEAFWAEQDANIRGRDYFKNYGWDYINHPIFDSGFNNPFDLNYKKYR
ncbi:MULTISPECIES: hypothetical protein [Flavobacterium]|uniref:hypothetical protein n=1 Tax=Flavobacterium TaxID=237 RepID=UPI00188B2A92|nr:MULTISPECIES: hypothetical protein [Flavobacterium]MBF4472949.1 hypothetical protein [Flavobacterium sp. HJJ]